jgi:hypothetical protein
MDWSASPLVALWFAVEDHKDGDGDMALWVYDRRTARANLGKLKARFKDVSDYEQLDDRQLHPSWANLVRSGSGLDGFDDPRDMVG